jgi:hypothetical protein
MGLATAMQSSGSMLTSWGGAWTGTFAAAMNSPILGVIGFTPVGMFAMVFKSMFDSIFRKIPVCNDPFTGEPLKGTGACSAASWRARCGNPATFDPKMCGPNLYDPKAINCPAGSSASDIGPFGVATGRCICDLSVYSKAEALKIGCDLSAVYKYAPLALLGAGIVLTLRHN